MVTMCEIEIFLVKEQSVGGQSAQSRVKGYLRWSQIALLTFHSK